MELIKILSTNHNDILKSRREKIDYLETKEKILKIKFLKVRKNLTVDLALDEKQLRYLTAVSNESIDGLSIFLHKGSHLLHLSNMCQKFVTEREKILKWLPIIHIECDDLVREDEMDQDGKTDDEKLLQQALEIGFSLPKLADDILEDAKPKKKPRPKTSILPRFIKSATSPMTTERVSTPENLKITPIGEVKIGVKKHIEKIEKDSLPSCSDGERNFLDRCYESLEKMENFWVTYNKVNINVLELRKEKQVLENENKQLRGLIRAVLEAAALAKNIPDSRVSTRVPSKRRSAHSAPLQRIIFN